MKQLIFILSLLSFEAFAIDSFSVSRRLGTDGERGTQILQLICADDKCLLSNGVDDKTTQKKDISKADAEGIFKSAEAAMPKSIPSKKLSSISFSLERGSKKIDVQEPRPELMKIEYKLQQMLIP